MKNINKYLISCIVIIIFGLSAIGSVDTDNDVGRNENYEKHSTISLESKEKFKSWAINTGGITYLEYPDNSDKWIWVRLSPEKYTTKDNVEAIAYFIGRAYKSQTGCNETVTVSIFYYYKDEIYLKVRVR